MFIIKMVLIWMYPRNTKNKTNNEEEEAAEQQQQMINECFGEAKTTNTKHQIVKCFLRQTNYMKSTAWNSP